MDFKHPPNNKIVNLTYGRNRCNFSKFKWMFQTYSLYYWWRKKMNKVLNIILISLFSLTVISCAKKSSTSSSSTTDDTNTTTSTEFIAVGESRTVLTSSDKWNRMECKTIKNNKISLWNHSREQYLRGSGRGLEC